MKIKLNDVLNAQEGLFELQKTKLPIKVSYWLKRMNDKLQPDLKVLFEKRMELMKEMGQETDKEKQLWTIRPEHIERYTAEINKLLDLELNVEWTAIDISELGEVTIEPKYIISWLFN